MGLTLKQNCKTSLLVPTSMGIRITSCQRTACSQQFTFSDGGFQCRNQRRQHLLLSRTSCKVLTTFVKDSPIANMIKSNLLSRHMTYEGAEVEQGNP